MQMNVAEIEVFLLPICLWFCFLKPPNKSASYGYLCSLLFFFILLNFLTEVSCFHVHSLFHFFTSEDKREGINISEALKHCCLARWSRVHKEINHVQTEIS